QHGSVTVRENEAVAVRPDGVCRIVTQELLPEGISDRSEGHRCAGVAGVSFLNRINRKRANCVDGQGVELLACQYRLIADCHRRFSRENSDVGLTKKYNSLPSSGLRRRSTVSTSL